jgi:hypothetical protein
MRRVAQKASRQLVPAKHRADVVIERIEGAPAATAVRVAFARRSRSASIPPVHTDNQGNALCGDPASASVSVAVTMYINKSTGEAEPKEYSLTLLSNENPSPSLGTGSINLASFFPQSRNGSTMTIPVGSVNLTLRCTLSPIRGSAALSQAGIADDHMSHAGSSDALSAGNYDVAYSFADVNTALATLATAVYDSIDDTETEAEQEAPEVAVERAFTDAGTNLPSSDALHWASSIVSAVIQEHNARMQSENELHSLNPVTLSIPVEDRTDEHERLLLRQEVKEKDHRLEILNNEADELKRGAESLSEELQHATEQRKQSEHERQSLRERISELERSLEHQYSVVKSAQTERDQALESMEAEQQLRQNAESARDETNVQLQNATNRANQAEDAHLLAEQQLEQANQQAQNAECERDEAKSARDSLKKLVDSLQKQTPSSPFADAAEDFDDSQDQRGLATAKQLLEEKDEELKEQKICADKASAEKQAMEEEVAELEDRTAEIGRQVQNGPCQKEDMLKKLEESRKDSKDAVSLQEEMNSLRKDLQQCYDTIAERDEQIVELSTQLEYHKQHHEQQQSQKRSVPSALEEASEQATTTSNSSTEEQQGLQSDVVTLQREVMQAQRNAREEQAARLKSEETLKSTESELINAKTQAATASSRVDELEIQLRRLSRKTGWRGSKNEQVEMPAISTPAVNTSR